MTDRERVANAHHMLENCDRIRDWMKARNWLQRATDLTSSLLPHLRVVGSRMVEYAARSTASGSR